MKIIETITKYIEQSRYETLPREVIEKAKIILLDTLGVGLSGAKTKPGKIMIEVIKN
jgi:2-methylcitrate dehydratase PrpD